MCSSVRTLDQLPLSEMRRTPQIEGVEGTPVTVGNNCANDQRPRQNARVGLHHVLAFALAPGLGPQDSCPERLG